MMILTLLLLLLIASPVSAVTMWEVDYLVRGDVSQATQFYGPGTYELLLAPENIPVYLKSTNWEFIGMYGQVVLPDSFPEIVFPAGIDLIVVSPVTAAVPEPSTLVLMGLGFLLLLAPVIFSVPRHRVIPLAGERRV